MVNNGVKKLPALREVIFPLKYQAIKMMEMKFKQIGAPIVAAVGKIKTSK